jgi:large subunit ribosomal protein L24
MKIKKGDQVQVITGNDKGKRGEVTRVMPDKNKLVVRGVNLVKKHQKKLNRNLRSQQTGLVEVEMPINASNVQLVGPDGKVMRVEKREKAA